MNAELQEFALQKIKDGLAQLPEDWQHRFKKMYSPDDLGADINDVVDAMPEDRLNWVMQQVQNSIVKNRNNEEGVK